MIPKFFDVHGHLNFAAYERDRDEVIKRALDGEVAMVAVGTQKDTSRAAVKLAKKCEGVFASVGLHPIHTGKSFYDKEELGPEGKEFTSRGEEFDYEYYKKLAAEDKVVAIGECGLDYFHNTNTRISANDTNKKKQGDTFRKQIELAIEVGKPLMLHLRSGENGDAYGDAFSILNSYFVIHNSRLRGNLHFFAGNLEQAKKFLDIGFYFSFTGVITFARSYDELIKNLPLDRIMSETDCPYVTPEPYRGKRNEPSYVTEVVKAIAEIRGEDFELVRRQLLQNANKFFNFNL